MSDGQLRQSETMSGPQIRTSLELGEREYPHLNQSQCQDVGQHSVRALVSERGNQVKSVRALQTVSRTQITRDLVRDIITFVYLFHIQLFPGGSDGKESACKARDPGLVPGSGRPPGEGNGYPLRYFCLGNPLDRGGWQATAYGAAKSPT